MSCQQTLVSLFFLFFMWVELAMAHSVKTQFGFIEKAILVDKNLMLSAKLDTGAKTSSLNASHIRHITVDGKPYLRFVVSSKEGDVVFQCEYVGNVKIKVRAGERRITSLLIQPLQRPVVLMALRLGNREKIVRVNLANRKRFIYPLLLGRDTIIAFNGVVDPAMKYTIKVGS